MNWALNQKKYEKDQLKSVTTISHSYLFVSIIAEVFATSALKACQKFTRIIPPIFALVGYICSLYFLTLVPRDIPLGKANGIWTGAGIALISVLGFVIFKQNLNYATVINIVLIISSCVLINMFSTSIHIERCPGGAAVNLVQVRSFITFSFMQTYQNLRSQYLTYTMKIKPRQSLKKSTWISKTLTNQGIGFDVTISEKFLIYQRVIKSWHRSARIIQDFHHHHKAYPLKSPISKCCDFFSYRISCKDKF